LQTPTISGPAIPLLQVPDIVRTPAQTTAPLLEILSPLIDHGIPVDQVMIATAAPFPVAGLSWYQDDYMYPRYTPYPHLHQGNDIFAAIGTPIIASSPGTVTAAADTAIGGLAVWILADDGTSFYYAHLSAFADGLQNGQRVDSGTLIGYIGNTGDAITASPHLHFEIHPPVRDDRGNVIQSGIDVTENGRGATRTPPTDPKPYLDGWLAQAEAKATQLVTQFVDRIQGIGRQLHFSQRVDDLFSADTVERPAELVWFSALEPVLGALGLARDAAQESAVTSQSAAERSADAQRLAIIRLAVEDPDLRLATFTGAFSGASSIIKVPSQDSSGG
jgi:peptidase M23-like protein